MWRRPLPVAKQQCRYLHVSTTRGQADSVIKIDQATFYKQFPSLAKKKTDENPPFFPRLSFQLPTRVGSTGLPEYWAVLSSSSIARTTFLQVLADQHVSTPPRARTYPLLAESSISPHHGIKYVGFDAERGSSVGGNNVRGAYLSARYESRREETDYSLLNYLTGHTELNALEHETSDMERQRLEEVIDQLNLRKLLEMPVANLSNGQTRRARVAKSLMAFPEVLLLDGPFMGLDPNTVQYMSSVLHKLAERQSPRLVMSLRPEDGVPDWITHLVIADAELMVLAQGTKKSVFAQNQYRLNTELGRQTILESIPDVAGASLGGRASRYDVSKDGFGRKSPALKPGEPVVEMQGVKVSYGDKTVLGDWTQTVHGEEKSGLWWSLHRGQRCGIFGPNGSGKTTMLSLITSDHPQAYSLPIKLFSRSRIPAPGELGISVFDLQRKMGHSSPEVHAFFPKNLTVRRSIESAWSDAPMTRAKLSAEADRRVDAVLRWFARELHPSLPVKSFLESLEARAEEVVGLPESRKAKVLKHYEENFHDDSDLTWADELQFRDLSFSSQRLVLFLRAIVAGPDLVILDEALSGIDEKVRDKALLFLSQGEEISTVHAHSTQPSVLSMIDKVSFSGLRPEQALLVISHSKEDVPGCVREWICLPEPGEGKQPRTGTLRGPLELNQSAWHNEIWRSGSSKK